MAPTQYFMYCHKSWNKTFFCTISPAVLSKRKYKISSFAFLVTFMFNLLYFPSYLNISEMILFTLISDIVRYCMLISIVC